MNLVKFYATVIDDNDPNIVELQVTREDDVKKNVYQKRLVCSLTDLIANVNDLTGNWRLIIQR
jgi:subtilisin-like proprotein convertase family protein